MTDSTQSPDDLLRALPAQQAETGYEPDYEPELELLDQLVQEEVRLDQQRCTFLLTKSMAGSKWLSPDDHTWEANANVDSVVASLVSLGVLAVIRVETPDQFYITPFGGSWYREQTGPDSFERQETQLRRYVNSASFRARHPDAYKKFSKADAALWDSEANSPPSTVGHLLLECWTTFLDDLVSELGIADQENRKNTKNRYHAIVGKVASELKSQESTILRAFQQGQEKLVDLLQAGKHSDEQADATFTRRVARRALRLTMLMMVELDDAVRNL